MRPQSVSRPSLAAAGAALLCLSLASAACRAETKLSGFGTLGLAHANTSEADFTSSVMKVNGAGATRRWSMDLDTRLGVQLDMTLGHRWSAVLQMVSEQRLDNSYRPRVEWANLKYQATPELALRVGRIALPMFLAADYRKVGYIYPWVRPPVEVYNAIPIASSDGADLTWRWSAGPVRNTTQAFVGHTEMPLLGGARMDADSVFGFSQTAEQGAFTARLSMITGRLTLDLARSLFEGLQAMGPDGRALAERYGAVDKRSTAIGLGLSYDPGDWFVMGEAGHSHSRSYLGSTSALYATAGYRWGSLTPYASYARVRADSPTHEPGLALDGMAPPLAAARAGLNYGLNALLATIPVQSTASVGTRWDCRAGMAFKLQYDRVTPHAGSRGTLINTTPAFRSGHTVQVASATLDFVF
jgi:hypothetical protein